MNLVRPERAFIQKIYFNVKDRFKAKYQLLMNRIEKLASKKIKSSKTFNDCLEQVIIFMKI